MPKNLRKERVYNSAVIGHNYINRITKDSQFIYFAMHNTYNHNHKRQQSDMRQQTHMNPNRNYVAQVPSHTCHHPASGSKICRPKLVTNSLSDSFRFIVSFRSAAEAQLDTNSKYRQLPCKTLISIGTCPFGERCE